jgi:hypothetical protein
MAQTHTSMSLRLWSLDWSAELPWHFEDGRAEAASVEEALPFMREHYPAIFDKPGEENGFLASPMTEAKRRFFGEMDFFMLRVGDDDAGIVMGHPSDWSSYYIRSVALLPQFRDRRLWSGFCGRLYEPLRAVGVERIEIETSPANVAMTRGLLGQGFLATASLSSERWGLLLRYSKFLLADAQDAFTRQYTATTFSQRARLNPNAQGGRHEEVRSRHHLI